MQRVFNLLMKKQRSFSKGTGYIRHKGWMKGFRMSYTVRCAGFLSGFYGTSMDIFPPVTRIFMPGSATFSLVSSRSLDSPTNGLLRVSQSTY